MEILIYDSESDGFVEEATKVHCIALMKYEDITTALYKPNCIEDGLSRLLEADVIVCHNEIKHDLPLFKKIYGWEPRPEQMILDTLVLSRMLHPKRAMPYGCKSKAPHSIESWGYRLGRGKPEHEDWSKYSDDMGHRCKEDVEINKLVLKELMNEVGYDSPYVFLQPIAA